ncbi:MAG: hypothetical protein V1493_01900 [Candidatus Diapherotrites archaeon]
MGMFDGLAGVYVKAEDAWYGLVDSLSDKGIPLYAYTDFLDKKGIPSFPFTIAILLLLIILAFLFLSSNNTDVNIRLKFADEQSQALNDVRVDISYKDGKLIDTKTLANNAVWPLKNIPLNSQLLITASKPGFETPEAKPLTVSGKNEDTVSFVFKKPRVLINGILQVKSETGTIIKNADCSVLTSDKRSISGVRKDINISFSNVPEGEAVVLACSANGYESIDEEQITFKKNTIATAVMKPKASLAGNERVDVLFRVLDKDSKVPIAGAHILILNDETDEPLFDENMEANGEYLAEILEGTVIRATIEAAGYITLTTDSTTIVLEMQPIEVLMEVGGKTVSVTVVSKSGLPVNDVLLSLYDADIRFIESKRTVSGPYGGNAVFTNLDPNKEYYITAYKVGFLPKRVKFLPADEQDLKIELENSSPSNSARLTLTILDSDGNPAKKAQVRFYEMVDGKKLPLGIGANGVPYLETDMQGKVSVVVPKGKILVEAQTGNEIQSKEFDVTQDTEDTIALEKKANLVELQFLDNDGNPIKGTVTIRSKSGKVLFTGRPDSEGFVVFDAEGEETFDVEVLTDDGKKFTEEVRIDSQKEGTVTISSVEAKLAPAITYEGVFDAKGQKVDGIAKGEYYWLKFVVSWQSNEQAGIHVRVGEDSKQFADSMEYGIYGFDGVAKKFFYGKSYQAPLGTREDKANAGKAGEKNKLLELYFDKPADQQVIKVKVMASETAAAKTMPVHFRAWVKAGDKYYRDPEDTELGTSLSTSGKASLYAETKSEDVKIYSSQPKCSEGLCLELSFFDDEGRETKTQDFKAVIGRRYALEARVNADAVKKAALTAETSAQEKIRFADFLETDFQAWPEEGYDKTTVSTGEISVSDSLEGKARAFFEAKAQGNAYIKITATEGENKIEKKIYFKITGITEMEMALAGNGTIKPGEKLAVELKGKETGEAITDAQFTVYAGERPVLSFKGNGIEGNGLGGKYSLGTEALEPGTYRLAASRRDYQDVEAQIAVSIENILTAAPEIEFFLDKEKPEAKETIELQNSVPTAKIEGLSYEFFPQAGWTNNFELEVLLPSAGVSGGRKAYPTLTVKYAGEDQEASLHAEGELVISGVLGNGLVVEAKTQVKANYNKPVPSECLVIKPAKNEVMLLSGANSSDSSVVLTVQYKASDKCTDPLVLKTKAQAKGGKGDPNIVITAPDLQISPGQEKEITVTATNTLERKTEPAQGKEYSLILESEKIAKSVLLKVYFINPLFSLQTNNNIMVFATMDDKGVVSGIAPLYIRNVGGKTVENIKATPKADTTFSVKIKEALVTLGPTAEAMATLKPGEELNPPWAIEITGKAKDYPESEYPIYLDVSGNIDGKKYDSMGLVKVLVRVSITQCLRANWVADNEYISNDSSQGVISHDVTLTNECGEALREITISPETFGENGLALYRPNALNRLEIGETATFQLKLTKRSDYFNKDRQDKVVAKGFLENSQQFIESNPITIILALGQTPETERGPSFDEVNVPVCGAEDTAIKAIRFPQTAHEAECEQAYCDAVQFSEFLAKKLSAAVKAAQDKMKSNNFSSKGCPELFCSFGALDVPSQRYTVYLRNDVVSPEVVKKGLGDYAPSLASYAVSVRPEKFEDIMLKATSFSPFNLYLSQPLQGCGKYEFAIHGAVQNASGALQKENMILYVEVTEDRKVTPECTNKIQNMMNFLPVDSGLSSSRALGTWAGMVQADKKLQEAGNDFAKTLFGASEGRVVLNTSSNKLLLLLKKLEGAGIMKLSIGQISETGAKPNTVTLELNALFDSDDQTIRNEVAAKAKEGLDAMAQGSFALDACIGENEDYMIVSKFEKLGELAIEGATEMQLYYDMKNCVGLKARGTIKGEKVMLKTNFSEMSPNEQAGIAEAWLELEGEGGARTVIAEYSDTEAGTQVELEPVEGKEGLNEKAFFLCAKGDDGQLFQAIGKKLKVKAKSASISESLDKEGEVQVREMVKWREVELTACGLHPYEMLKKISEQSPKKGEPIEAYTILVWKGDPEELTLKSMIAAWRAFKSKPGTDSTDEEGKTVADKVSSAKKWSLLAYFGACTAVSSICNGVMLKVWLSFTDILFNCGIPTIAGLWGPQISGGLGKVWDGIKGFFHVETVHEMTNSVQELVQGSGDSGEAVEVVEENLVTGAILGVSARGALRAIGTANFTTNMSATITRNNISGTIDALSKEIAGNTVKGLGTGTLKGAPGLSTITKNMEREYAARLATQMKSQASAIVGKGSPKFEALPWDDVAKASWGDAANVVGPTVDIGMLGESPLGKTVKSALTKKMGEVLDSTKVAKGAVEDLPNTLRVGGRTGYASTDALADDLMERAWSQIDGDALVAKNPALSATNMKATIKAKIRGQIGTGTTVSKASAERGIKGGVSELTTNAAYKDDLLKAVGGNADDLTKKAFTDSYSGIGDLKGGLRIKERIKNLLKTLRTRQFWGKMLKSVGCGALANLAGLQAQQAVLNWRLGELKAEAAEGQGFDFTGPLSNYEGVEVFRKFKPYKITIARGDNDIVKVSIAELMEDDEITDMGKAITADPTKYWKAEDCKAQLNQGIDELIGCLTPDSETKGVTQAQVKAYYENNAKIAAVCIGDDPANRLDEALLMSVLFTSPENIEGCCDEDQCIQEDWYNKSESEQEHTIDCAAGELKKAMGAGSDRETVKKLAALSLSGQELEEYADNVLATYAVWQEFNFCEEGS